MNRSTWFGRLGRRNYAVAKEELARIIQRQRGVVKNIAIDIGCDRTSVRDIVGYYGLTMAMAEASRAVSKPSELVLAARAALNRGHDVQEK